MRLVLLETRQLHARLAPLTERARAQQAAGDAGADPALAAQLVTHHMQAHWNKRCVLAYHRQRLDWLKARVWDKAGALALVLDQDGEPGTSLRPLLDPSELEWVRSYAALVALYKDAFLDVVDVTLPLASGSGRPRHDGTIVLRARDALASTLDARNVTVYAADTPPNTVRAPDDLMVTVLVVRDAPDVETERGTMHLRAGERLHVRRDEVEPLLLRGRLRVVDA